MFYIMSYPSLIIEIVVQSQQVPLEHGYGDLPNLPHIPGFMSLWAYDRTSHRDAWTTAPSHRCSCSWPQDFTQSEPQKAQKICRGSTLMTTAPSLIQEGSILYLSFAKDSTQLRIPTLFVALCHFRNGVRELRDLLVCLASQNPSKTFHTCRDISILFNSRASFERLRGAKRR